MSHAFGFDRKFVFRAQASRISFTSNSSSSQINHWSFTNQPSAPFEYASGTSTSFPQMNTYGRASSLLVGARRGSGPKHCPSPTSYLGARPRSWTLGRILQLLAPRRRQQCCPWVPQEDPLRQKVVDGGGNSGLEAGAGGDSPRSQRITSPSHPFSGMVPGTRTERSALMMRSASLMNPFGKGVTSTSSRLRLWPATSSQRCSS